MIILTTSWVDEICVLLYTRRNIQLLSWFSFCCILVKATHKWTFIWGPNLESRVFPVGTPAVSMLCQVRWDALRYSQKPALVWFSGSRIGAKIGAGRERITALLRRRSSFRFSIWSGNIMSLTSGYFIFVLIAFLHVRSANYGTNDLSNPGHEIFFRCVNVERVDVKT